MSSVTGELERLTALHKEGALTEEELAAAKQQVLSDGPEEDSDEDRDLALVEAEQLLELGRIEIDQSNYDEALHCYQGALDIFRSHGDRAGEGKARGHLGNISQAQGQYERATQFFAKAVAIGREIGDKRREGIHLGNLGLVKQAQGQHDQAIEFLTQAIEIAAEIGDKRFEGIHLGNLGLVNQAQGQHERAMEHLTQALDIAKEIGDRRFVGIHLGNLGDVLLKQNRLDEAESALRQAILINDKTFPVAAGAFGGSLAWLLAQQEQIEEAQTLLKTGQTQVESYPEELAKFLCKKGQVQHLAGDAEGASTSLQQARALEVELKVSDESEIAQAIRELEAVLSEG